MTYNKIFVSNNSKSTEMYKGSERDPQEWWGNHPLRINSEFWIESTIDEVFWEEFG